MQSGSVGDLQFCSVFLFSEWDEAKSLKNISKFREITRIGERGGSDMRLKARDIDCIAVVI